MHNRVAKLICNRGKRYSARWWLEGCENSCEVSLASARQPLYLPEKLVGGKKRPFYTKRLLAGGDLRGGPGSQPRLELASNSWRHRVQREWSDVPVGVRTSSKLVSFKTELRTWLKTSILNYIMYNLSL